MSSDVGEADDVAAVVTEQPALITAAPAAPTLLDVERVQCLLIKLYENLLRQVMTLIVAVSICMLSVSVLIRINQFSHNYAPLLGYARFAEDGADAVGMTAEGVVLMNSFGNALSFLSTIVIVNVLLVLLYKRGHYNIIQAWMMTGTSILLFLTSYYYMGRIAFYVNVPVDHLSWSLVIWNVGVTGIRALYYEGPFIMQQGYLVYISVLMALILEESFPEWTSWILLVLVSIWDVFAVLCIVGPLRILLETAKERNEPLFPALVFSTSSAWCYHIGERSINVAQTGAPSATFDGAKHCRAGEETAGQEAKSEATSAIQGMSKKVAADGLDLLSRRALPVFLSLDEEVVFDSRSASPHDKRYSVADDVPLEAPCAANSTGGKRQNVLSLSDANSTGSTNSPNRDKAQSSGPSAADSGAEECDGKLTSTRLPNSDNADGAAHKDPQDIHLDPEDGTVVHPVQGGERGSHNSRDHRSHRHRNARSARQQAIRDEASGDRGMKMGLGDFIFYSVLVGKASRHGTVFTIISCYVAVIVGILLTLFLLVLLQKPLPALPFSISLGIMAYFSSAYLTEPFMDVVDSMVY